MSARGELNKAMPKFAEIVRNISRQGLMEVGHGNVPVGTRKTLCYVCEVHDGEETEDELRWTVDVMDVNYDAEPKDGVEGYHPGVRLCASNTNANGFILVPEIYSEVIIERDPASNIEFVSFVSRVAKVMMEGTESIKVGCTEYEDFSESDDGLEKDFDELDETGDYSYTEYTKNKKVDKVVSGDDSTEIRQTKNQVFVDCEDIQMHGSTYHAVLFEELKAVMTKLIQYLATATAAGSPLSTAANINALLQELDNFKSSTLKIGE